MKVLFIFPIPRIPRFARALFNLGIGHLSAILKRHQHETDLLSLSSYDRKGIRQKIKLFSPDLIAVSSTSDQIELSRQIISYIKSYFQVPIVLGGVHATYLPQESIAIEGLLGICLGEGEYPLLELVECLGEGKDYRRINNFWFKEGNGIIKNDLRPPVIDLDSLPFPDREIFDTPAINKAWLVGMQFMASRGCLSSCTNCNYPALRKIYKLDRENYVRLRSVDSLLTEIDSVIKRYKSDSYVNFEDDSFTGDKNWLREFSVKYSKGIRYPFFCNARADEINEESIGLLKKANCRLIRIGIESGDEYIRNVILKKGITNNDIIKAFQLAKKYGIKTLSFNMLGLPFETEEFIKKTIKLNQEIQPDFISLSYFRPYPGTDLYNLCKEKNLISQRKASHWLEDTILDQPAISKSKVRYYMRVFGMSVRKPKTVILIKLTARLYIWKNFTLFDFLKGTRDFVQEYFLRNNRKI
ncbi:MAG: radical SAM protein [Candidatus Omnitrophota bacterium]